MCMTVQMVARSCDSQEPVDGFEPGVRLCIVIMDTKGRRVCDEDVHVTSVVDAVQEQLGHHFERTEVGVCLSVLIRPIGAVLDASAQSADQECFETNQLQVQI